MFGEWRRAGVAVQRRARPLAARPRRRAPGWGLLDARRPPEGRAGTTCAARSRRVAVWTTDEGLNGIDVHVANDGAQPLRAELRVALYAEASSRSTRLRSRRAAGARHARAERRGAARAIRRRDVGLPLRAAAHDAVVATLERDGQILSQTFRFPIGPPLEQRSADELGVRLDAERASDGSIRATVATRGCSSAPPSPQRGTRRTMRTSPSSPGGSTRCASSRPRALR